MQSVKIRFWKAYRKYGRKLFNAIQNNFPPLLIWLTETVFLASPFSFQRFPFNSWHCLCYQSYSRQVMELFKTSWMQGIRVLNPDDNLSTRSILCCLACYLWLHHNVDKHAMDVQNAGCWFFCPSVFFFVEFALIWMSGCQAEWLNHHLINGHIGMWHPLLLLCCNILFKLV